MADTRSWLITDHCCRSCYGRVLRCEDVFMCSVCEVQTAGKPDGICGCGIRGMKGHAKCGVNQNVGPENPQRVIIHVAVAARASK